MSINDVPLLPHILSLEILTYSAFVFLSIFYFDPITTTVGGILFHAIPETLSNMLSYLLLYGIPRD